MLTFYINEILSAGVLGPVCVYELLRAVPGLREVLLEREHFTARFVEVPVDARKLNHGPRD